MNSTRSSPRSIPVPNLLLSIFMQTTFCMVTENHSSSSALVMEHKDHTVRHSASTRIPYHPQEPMLSLCTLTMVSHTSKPGTCARHATKPFPPHHRVSLAFLSLGFLSTPSLPITQIRPMSLSQSTVSERRSYFTLQSHRNMAFLVISSTVGHQPPLIMTCPNPGA